MFKAKQALLGRFVVLLVFALVALVPGLAIVSHAMAGEGNVGNTQIAPPQSHFHGQTYGEWSAAWFQWVLLDALHKSPAV